MGAIFLKCQDRRSILKRVLSRAQMRLADRSDACEGPGWARTEHMQQESGYVGGVPKMATGAEAFLEDAGCWQASLQNARELLEAAGARERARVGGSGRRVDCPRAWLAPGSPEEGTTPRPAKEGWRWPGVISLCRKSSAGSIYRGRRHQTKEAQAVEYILVGTLLTNIFPQDYGVVEVC